MHRVLILCSGDAWLEPLEGDLREASFEPIRVSDQDGAVRLLKEGRVDAVVVEKGWCKGNAAKDMRRALGSVPRVVVSNDNSYRGVASWLRDRPGASLRMPVEGAELVGTLNNVLRFGSAETERRHLAESARSQARQMRTFEELTRALTSTLDTEVILDVIMKKATALTQAEAWSLLLKDEETGDLVFQRVRGGAGTSLKEKRIAPDRGIVGWVAREGKPAIVNDAEEDSRFLGRVDQATGFRTKNLLCVPIQAKGRVIGVLEVVNKKGGEDFTEHDLEVVGRFVGHAALALELADLYQKMAEMAITDDLTKLFNMRYLNRTIEGEIERSNRYGTAVSLIFLDMDHFKNINDTHGHLVGSKLLVEVAQRLLGSLRTVDIVARYGGDEFVIVLPQTGSDDAMLIAERLREELERHVFLKEETGGITITASLGVASFPETAKTKEELMKMADEAMYCAKKKSRNAVYRMTASGN